MRVPILAIIAHMALLQIAGQVAAQSSPDRPELPLLAEVRIDIPLSPDIVNFIATQAARSEAPRTRGSVVDLVRESCGFTSPNNEAVFEAALLDQGARVADGAFEVDATSTEVPPCLPDETLTRVVGRLPGPGDSFYAYLESDLGVRLTESTDLAPTVRIDPGVQIDMLALGRGNAAALPFPMGRGGPEPAEVVALAQESLRNSMADPSDASRIAFEGFVAAKSMIDAGLGPELSRTTVKLSLEQLGVEDPDPILLRIDAALRTQQQVPLIRDLPIMAETCSDPTGRAAALCAMPASGVPVTLPDRGVSVITSLNDPSWVPDPRTIFRNVPVVSVEQQTRTATLPLADVATPPPGVTARVASAEEVASAVPETGELTLFDNVVEEAGKTCNPGGFRNWGSPEFDAAFREALQRAAAISKASRSLGSTQVLVMDGGFLRLETAAFGLTSWDSVKVQDLESTADSLVGMDDELRRKVIHGTVVAGLALGGPALMDSFGDAGLDVTLELKRIFKLRSRNGAKQFEPLDNLTGSIRRTDADIINLSFSASDDRIGRLDWFRDHLMGPTGGLFIVAAGNNGNNSETEGQSISGWGLFPQSWGRSGDPYAGDSKDGFNVLVVAALDRGEEDLAWFSNYGSDLVFIAAPGCDVEAIAPMPTGEGYEVQRFSGTSFAAPIVTYVAAALRSVMPVKTAPWVRARLLATADINVPLHDTDRVSYGRLLNPIAALRIYDDVVTLRAPMVSGGPKEIDGELIDTTSDGDFDVSSLCRNGSVSTPHSLLRLFNIAPPGEPESWMVDFITGDDVFVSRPCTLIQQGTLMMRDDGAEFPIFLDQVTDIKFALPKGD